MCIHALARHPRAIFGLGTNWAAAPSYRQKALAVASFFDAQCSLLMASQPPSNGALLALYNVRFSMRQTSVLRTISFAMQPAECLAIVGPNGAGKTTLLKILSGLYRDYQGSAQILGKEIKSEPIESLARLVSLVPQRMEFLPSFTVAEYMTLSGPMRGPHVGRLIAGLEHRVLPELSGGELQRVVIAGAVAQGVKLLLLDEPSSHLDPRGRTEVERVLRECREQFGISYVVVTHDISLALRCCSRMLVVGNGELRWSGAVTDESIVRELEGAYGCGFVRLEHASLPGAVVVPV